MIHFIINIKFFINIILFTSGSGLFARKNFNRGDFVIEYTGKLLMNDPRDQKKEAYIYEFAYNGKKYW